MWGTAPGDQRADLQFADEAAILVVVVAAVAQDGIGPLERPTAFASDLGDGVQQRP